MMITLDCLYFFLVLLSLLFACPFFDCITLVVLKWKDGNDDGAINDMKNDFKSSDYQLSIISCVFRDYSSDAHPDISLHRC